MATRRKKPKAKPKAKAPQAKRPSIEIQWTPESETYLAERLLSPDGKGALRQLSQIIVESFVSHMTEAERQAFSTPEGQKAFLEVWPEIVDAFLHPNPTKVKKRTGKK